MHEVAISRIFIIMSLAKMFSKSGLARFLKVFAKHTVRKEITLHLSTVALRKEEFEMQYARDAVEAAAAAAFTKVQEDCAQWQRQMGDRIYSCIEERVYQRLCEALLKNGLIERIADLRADMNTIADSMRDLMKDVGNDRTNLWTGYHDLIGGLNTISLDMRGMQAEIEALEDRLENSRIN